MTNMEKIAEMVKNDPSLQEKLDAESKRLAESGKTDIREISADAVKAVFGVELTGEELDQLTDTNAKMDLDELDNVAGGIDLLQTAIGTLQYASSPIKIILPISYAVGDRIRKAAFGPDDNEEKKS